MPNAEIIHRFIMIILRFYPARRQTSSRIIWLVGWTGSITKPTKTAKNPEKVRRPPPDSLAQAARFFVIGPVGKALVFEELDVWFLAPIQDHPHLPGARKHLRILDRHFVVDVIDVAERVAFDQMQGVAVEIAGPVEPGLVVEMDHVNH